MPEPTDDEKRLLDALDDTESANAPLQREAQKVVAEAQEHRDVARELKQYVQANPLTMDSQLVKQLTSAVQRQSDAARSLRADMRESVQFYTDQGSLSSTAVSTVVTGLLTNGPAPIFKMPYSRPQYLQMPAPQRTQLATALEAIYTRHDLFASVREALVALGLDKAGGTLKSPVTFLDNAKANFDAPSADNAEAIAVLLSLRSCIKETLSELIRRRPKPEATGSSWKAKLASLGTQCGRENLPSGYWDQLADLALTHADVFDGSKQQTFPRPVVVLHINSGLRFLQTLVNGIDKQKLRP